MSTRLSDQQFLDSLQSTADRGGYVELTRGDAERLCALAGSKWVKGILDPEYVRLYHVEVWKIIARARERPLPLFEFEIPNCYVHNADYPLFATDDTQHHTFVPVIPAEIISMLALSSQVNHYISKLVKNSPRYLLKVQVFERPLNHS